MPFARHSREIACGLEHFGDRDRAIGDAALQTAHPGAHNAVEPSHSRFVRIEARQQRRARGAATRRIVELCEAEAVLGQRVEVGGRDLASIGADVREAHVVDEDDDHIGALRLLGRGGRHGGRGLRGRGNSAGSREQRQRGRGRRGAAQGSPHGLHDVHTYSPMAS